MELRDSRQDIEKEFLINENEIVFKATPGDWEEFQKSAGWWDFRVVLEDKLAEERSSLESLDSYPAFLQAQARIDVLKKILEMPTNLQAAALEEQRALAQTEE